MNQTTARVLTALVEAEALDVRQAFALSETLDRILREEMDARLRALLAEAGFARVQGSRDLFDGTDHVPVDLETVTGIVPREGSACERNGAAARAEGKTGVLASLDTNAAHRGNAGVSQLSSPRRSRAYAGQVVDPWHRLSKALTQYHREVSQHELAVLIDRVGLVFPEALRVLERWGRVHQTEPGSGVYRVVPRDEVLEHKSRELGPKADQADRVSALVTLTGYSDTVCRRFLAARQREVAA